MATRIDTGQTLFVPPPAAVDSHVHLFDGARFPYVPDRRYTPATASVADLRAFLKSARIGRAVLVQPSVYGSDNRCLLDGLAQLGPEVVRGIAVIDAATVTNPELRALMAAGVVGVRVNLNTRGAEEASAALAALAAIAATIARVADVGLLVQIYVAMPLLAALERTIAGSRVPVVLDHFAGASAGGGLSQQGFGSLARLLAEGKVWVKLSAPYRASPGALPYADVEPIAREMMRLNPERLVWASDWPHTGGGAERKARPAAETEPFRDIDDAGVLGIAAAWCGSDPMRDRLFVTNPARLFGFRGGSARPQPMGTDSGTKP